MAVARDFDLAWGRYQEYRKLAAGITEGNRCAMVLAMALGTSYYPEPAKKESSFADLRDSFAVNLKGTLNNVRHGKIAVANRMDDAIEGQPFLKKYYVKAEQFATRLAKEWGKPDYVVSGANKEFASRTRHQRGVIFIQDGWASGEDHVDLWNGDTMAAYKDDAAYAVKHLEQSKTAWLWAFDNNSKTSKLSGRTFKA